MAGEPLDPVAAGQFDELVTAYRKLLRDTILKVCPRDLGLQVDDIEQEVRIRLWRAIRNETDIRDRASYIYKVAFTATIDAIRRVKARREEPLDPADDDLPAGALSLPAQGTPEQIAGRRELFSQSRGGARPSRPGPPAGRGPLSRGPDPSRDCRAPALERVADPESRVSRAERSPRAAAG